MGYFVSKVSLHTPPILPLHSLSTSQGQPPQQTAPAVSEVPRGPVPDEEVPAGYPKLAERMGYVPETAIFRRFGALNAQNLLYLQAELVSMEERLRKLQRADSKSSSGKKNKYARNWFWLSQSRKDGDEKQWRLVRRIRQTLNEYNSTVLQQASILRIRPPGAYDLDYIQRYLETYGMGPLALTGRDAGVWGSTQDPKSHADDLVALLPRHNEDFFSKWVTEKASIRLSKLFWCRRQKSSPKSYGLECFEDDILLRWTHRMTSILASVLPIVSITILYCVESLEIRLGIIAVFNLVLSFCLTVFTTAKRIDIFAVAAAFSAVQVVFVQVGTQSNS